MPSASVSTAAAAKPGLEAEQAKRVTKILGKHDAVFLSRDWGTLVDPWTTAQRVARREHRQPAYSATPLATNQQASAAR